MARSLKDITNLWKAAENEFFALNPDIYGELMAFFGGKITEIRKEVVNEEDYIREWKDKELICI